ncbi:Multidrug resistance-associated protein 4 [Nymphon striatum]|nr:Multidrug resistance-associated protein 4 [Nymphon striatum]
MEKLLKRRCKSVSEMFVFYIFRWTIPTLIKGWKGHLKPEDYTQIPNDLRTKDLALKLSKYSATENSSKIALVWSLFRLAKKQFVIALFFCSCLELVVKTCLPLLFSMFLTELQKNEDDYSQNTALLYCLSMCVIYFMYPIISQQFLINSEMAGMMIQNALCSNIYRKITKMSNKGYMETNSGEIMNIMTNDINVFDIELKFAYYIILAPIQCVIVCTILWLNVGALPILGLLGLLAIIPVQLLFSKGVFKYRKKVLAETDKRVNLINQVVGAMKTIKLYAWEDSFWKHLQDKRKRECHRLNRITLFKSASSIVFGNMIYVIILLTMVGFVFSETEMSISKVYLAINMLYSVRLGMTLFFSNGLNGLATLLSSIQRIQKFLSNEEYPEKVHEKLIKDSKSNPVVHLDNVDSSWGMSTRNVLNGISFQLNPGDYLSVIGEVGSGKTSLLKTILKEMNVNNGSLRVEGKVAYACQQSWIFSDTVKNNIIFGSEFNPKKYRKVIEACCLLKDIQDMKNGDETIVGERGIQLSGGQRARISLARALYYDADIYLLDDPLSAVDAEVGNHLYTKCIQEYLAKKIRILVTHQINYLKHAPKILLLTKNAKPLCGTYDELLKTYPHLATFFTDSSKKHVDKKEPKRQSQIKLENKEAEGLKKLDRAENATAKAIPFKVYRNFFKAAGNPFFIVVTILMLNLVNSLFLIGADIWIMTWTEAERTRQFSPVNGNASESIKRNSNFLLNYLVKDNVYNLQVLALFVASGILMYIPASIFDMMTCVKAGRHLHDKMFDRLLHAPIKFFNSNPIGEILNRFTKDIGHIDHLIPQLFQEFSNETMRLLVMIVAVCIVDYYLILVTIVSGSAAVFAGMVFTKSYTTFKRAENITKSPVFTHVSITLDGLSTIRAYDALDRFQNKLNDLQDLNIAVYYMHLCVQRWFAIFFQYACTVLLCASLLTPVIFRGKISASSTGFLITQLAQIALALQWRVRVAIELQSKFTSVERVMEYGEIESEAARECTEENRPPKDWPQKGFVEASNMSLAYNKNNYVLKDICFTIKGSQKVGIVGRTGAGKTSLINALFRLTEPKGTLKIDGVNISNIGLHQLRRNISIIPQEPVLFQDTIRFNMDPFSAYDDSSIWEALQSVELKSVVGKFPKKLETELTEGGFSLSLGQQQLICLARAIIKQNKIIVMDEATSNVDVITDKLIQRTIRTKFKDFTVITIAHRIHTIIDSDVIMAEFDSPKALVRNTNSQFYKMIMETGSSAPLLFSQALNGRQKALETPV